MHGDGATCPGHAAVREGANALGRDAVIDVVTVVIALEAEIVTLQSAVVVSSPNCEAPSLCADESQGRERQERCDLHGGLGN